MRTAVKHAISERLPDSVDLQLRALPSFIVIGTQRGGTTSLYDHLTKHPRIRSAKRKEVHFFDNQYTKGVDWYRGQFPRVRFRPRMITGEATPYYLFHPEVPRRVRTVVPKARFIVLLREPVSRAYSHYHVMRHRRKWETLSFADAVAREDERLAGEEQKLVDPAYRSEPHQHLSYVRRGIYADQLLRWFDVFDRDRFLVLCSERFYADPGAALVRVTNFLGIEPVRLDAYAHRNLGNYEGEMDPGLRAELRERFRPHNERLFELIGDDFGWNDG